MAEGVGSVVDSDNNGIASRGGGGGGGGGGGAGGYICPREQG